MDWAISTCLVVFLSGLLSLLTDGTKLSAHINRVLGLVCLLAVFSPLISNLTKGEFFNLSTEINTQQTFLTYIQNANLKNTEEIINKTLKDNGITGNFNIEITINDEDNTAKRIVIYLNNATKEQISLVTGEISKKLNIDERIILICSE